MSVLPVSRVQNSSSRVFYENGNDERIPRITRNALNPPPSYSESLTQKAIKFLESCRHGYIDRALMADPIALGCKEYEKEEVPLHLACKNGHLNVVRALIGRGADLNEENLDGDTSLDLACKAGFKEIAICLLQSGAEYSLSELVQKTRGAHFIYEVATAFHKTRIVSRDPNSPFYPIFEALIQCKERLDGQRDPVEIVLDENIKLNGSRGERCSKYVWIYRLLLGLQELASLEFREFIRSINLPNAEFFSNPAIVFCQALSGQVIHFERSEMSVDKVDWMIDLLFKEFGKVNDPSMSEEERKEKLLHFFNGAFDPDEKNYCFDHKISILEQYGARSVMKEDFVVDINPNMGSLQRAFAYFDAFRNRQIDKMAGEEKKKYLELKEQILSKHNETMDVRRRFYSSYCTKIRFQDFLEKEFPRPYQDIFDQISAGDLDDYISPFGKSFLDFLRS